MTKRLAVSFLNFMTRIAPESPLTPAQRIVDAIAFDGLEPGQLEGTDRDLAIEMYGPDVDVIPPVARSVVVRRKGARSGDSWRSALRGLHLALTHPLDSLQPSELGFAIFTAPDIRLARQPLRYARGAADRVPGVRIEQDGHDGFTIVRPDGKRVRLESLPASRGGSSLRGRSIACGVMDECCFFRDEQSGAINDVDLYRAMLPRIVPGGQLIAPSTPWAESGLLYDLFTKNWNHPVTALAANCPTLTMRNDAYTRSMVARERERDPENAAREYDAEFITGGSGAFFDSHAITQAADPDMPIELSPETGWSYYAGIDPAFKSDSFSGVIVRRKSDLFQVAAVFERKPKRGSPLVPSQAVKEFAEVAKRFGVREAATDSFYVESIKEHLEGTGLRCVEEPAGHSGKLQVYTSAQELIHSGKVSWSGGHKSLTLQLREITKRASSGGLITIASPRRRGNHGDTASALIRGLWLAKLGGMSTSPEEREACRAANQRLMNSPAMSRWGRGGGRGRGF